MSRITDIRRSGPGFRRRTLVIDGDAWRDIPSAVANQLGFEVGDEVDLSEIEVRIDTAEVPRAREKAIALITARERSHAGLAERLVEDGYSRGVAESTASDLERIGLVDDERFAHAMARTLANARGKGRSGIARELKMAGISEEMVSEALDAALTPDDEYASARVLADSAARRSGATVDKVASKVARRGYRLPLALTVAREALEAHGRAQDPADGPDAAETYLDD